MMPRTMTLLMIASAKIARIGLKSNPPNDGITRRKMRRIGLAHVAQEAEDRVHRAVVRGP